MKKILSFLIFISLILPVSAKTLIPGGESAGVVLNYDGVLITGSYAFFVDGKKINLNEDVFKKGDLIISCNHEEIDNMDDLIEEIQASIYDQQDIQVEIKRDGQIKNKTLEVYYDSQTQSFKTGLYISDHLSAVGTITYYDPETKTYGAFGHQLETTTTDLDIEACEIFDAYITSIQPNTQKAIGKKIGTIDATRPIGNVTHNHQIGIFGSYQHIYKDDLTLYETAKPKLGEAYIMTTLLDNQTRSYEIRIDQLSTHSEKNITFHIVDEELLKITNGIVPGMSGSPIIQNGKIVGAVTHVLVNDPQSGYGIFIENMLEVAE